MFRKPFHAALPLIAAALAAAGPVLGDPGAHVTLSGTMQSSGSVTKQFTVHVPPGIRELTVNLPVPSSVDENGWRQSVTACVTTSSSAPTRQVDEVDAVGNRYRVIKFYKPQPEDIRITQRLVGVTTQASLDNPLPSAAFPLTTTSDAAAPYLKSSRLAESDDPAIFNLAIFLTRDLATEAEAVARIARWTFNHIDYAEGNYIPEVDASSTLQNRCAQCRGYANLFIALARAAGIPARMVTGYTLSGSMNVPLSSDGLSHLSMDSPSSPHAWVEIWYPGAGWTPYDPQASAGFIDSHHIEYSVCGAADTERPIIEWDATDRACGRVQFQEDNATGDLSDTISLHYVDQGGGEVSGHVLLERQSPEE